MIRSTLLLLGLLAQEPSPLTASKFLSRGAPTFVVGTAGDEACDRGTSAQVRFIRDLLFPTSPIVPDSSLELGTGIEAWPEVAVLYGGSHTNSAFAAIEDSLPFRVGAGRLEIADLVFEGPEYRLIAVVPEDLRPAAGPAHPAFLLYAGTGSPGVTEINAVPDYNFGFVVADRFGRSHSGRFERDAEGALVAVVEDVSRRLPWRSQRVELEGELGEIVVHRLELEPVDAQDAPENAACARGLSHAARALGLSDVRGVEVYVYPDRRSKQQLQGSRADGNAECNSTTLHVLPFEASEGGLMEALIRHEGAHVLAAQALGTASAALWGEGLAVWAAGGYGGQDLASFSALRLPAGVGLRELLGPGFSKLREPLGYPIAGRMVGALIEEHGLESFLAAFYSVAPSDLEASCRRLGTTLAEIEAPFLHDAKR
jgi:hypothetical protein